MADEAHVGSLLDYDVITAGSTYWYSRREPLNAFGHGLSYTQVDYGRHRAVQPVLEIATTSAAGNITEAPAQVVEAGMHVTNTGTRPVAELVQPYVAADAHRLPVSHRRLVGHARVLLEPGASAVIALPVAARDLAVWDVSRDRFVTEPGHYHVLAGGSILDLPLSADLAFTASRCRRALPWAGCCAPWTSTMQQASSSPSARVTRVRPSRPPRVGELLLS